MASKGESTVSNTPTIIKEPVIGIDLGTTYSCVAVWHRNKVEIILNDIDQRLTPSCVAFTDDEILVGQGAKNQITSNPQNTIFDVKRLIGRRFNDAVVQKDMELWPFTVVEGSKGEPKIWVEYQGEEKTHTVQEISSMVLRKMKDSAEAFLKCEVKNAVITVPAYFNDSQRRATRDAGQIAGLNVVRVINEPTAAALAYAHNEQHRSKKRKKVLIFDLGGGTLDVSIVEMEGSQFNVQSTAGDTHLGGEDFDNCMVKYMTDEFKRMNKVDITKKPKPLRRLRKESEKAKRKLSSANQVWIDVDGLYGEIDFRMKITRAKFEELNKSLFHKCLDPISQCLNGAGMKTTNIDEVVLVGGSSRIPKIRQLVNKYFDIKEACHTVNPDEAVAIGAAIQGAILCKVQHGDIIDLRVFDVTPLSLGINNGGKMSFVVNRSTPIPVQIPSTRYTAFDNQTQMVFQVFEGERSFVKDNHLLGDFTLDGITRAPAARKAAVELTFKIDEDGILTVTAKDKESGREKSLKIKNYSGRLDTEEINRIIEDGKKWQAHDDKLKDQAYAKNELETSLNNMIRKLNNVSLKKRIGEVTCNKLKGMVSDLKKWTEMEGNTASCEVLKKKIIELKKIERILK